MTQVRTKATEKKKIEKPTLKSNEDQRAYLYNTGVNKVYRSYTKGLCVVSYIYLYFLRRLYTIINVVGSYFKTAG